MGKTIHQQKYHRMIALLRQKRESCGVTQVQLAKELNISQAAVSKIESCERRIDIIELMDICRVINLPFEEFIAEFNSII